MTAPQIWVICENCENSCLMKLGTEFKCHTGDEPDLKELTDEEFKAAWDQKAQELQELCGNYDITTGGHPL